MRLVNKVAIVTGAGGGIGTHTVKALVKEGAKVVAADLNVENVNDYKNTVFKKSMDITKQNQVEELIKYTIDLFGKIDILVNMAGAILPPTSIDNITNHEWDHIMAVNNKSLFLLCREVVPVMKNQGSGVIVNIGSISTVRPTSGILSYITSKGATLAFTQALAVELSDYKIRVNAINPGPTNTRMIEYLSDNETVMNSNKEKLKSNIPLGELVQPEDIANGVVYLASDHAKMITGSIVNIDGGRAL